MSPASQKTTQNKPFTIPPTSTALIAKLEKDPKFAPKVTIDTIEEVMLLADEKKRLELAVRVGERMLIDRLIKIQKKSNQQE